MQYRVEFYRDPDCNRFYAGNLECTFYFSVIDSLLIDTPKERESKHKLKLIMTEELIQNWQLKGSDLERVVSQDMVKVAYQGAENFIKEQIEKGNSLPKKLKFVMNTENSPKSPYNLSNIKYPEQKFFTVNIHKQDEEEMDTTIKTKILFLGANPSQTIRLKLGEEIKKIQTNLKLAKERDTLELKQEWAVTPDSLMQAILDESPNIVHFSGHGRQEGIILQNEIGEPKIVSTEALTRLFKLFKDTVNCVILNSCYSELQAQAIKRHIPYVIGMRAGFPDKAAIAFSTGFYKAVGAGKDIPFAFELGVAAIHLEGVSGDDIPVLL